MPRERLTKRTIDALAPGARPFIVWDGELSGFGVRVTPASAKAYVLQYRVGDGGRSSGSRRMTIAQANELTPDQARKRARELLAKVRLGGDPLGERRHTRQALTVNALADAFLSEHVEVKRKAATLDQYRRLLRDYVRPKIGARRAEEVTRADIARLHHALHENPHSANRTLAVIGSMYSWGEGRGLLPEGCNPTRRIEKYREEGRERYLSTDELRRLGEVLREAETVGLPYDVDDASPNAKHAPQPENRRTVVSPFATAAIRLLLFTGARVSEILHLEWRHVDLERGLLLLPDSKTGKKAIILNAPALAVLSELPRAGGYVTAGDKPNAPRSDLKRPWAAVRLRAGLDDVRLHDLRHSFASVGAGRGLGLPIVGALLGHTQARTTAKYAHLDADPLRRASEHIGRELAAALDGRPATKVVKSRREGGT